MDHREQDTQNTLNQTFHPLQFALLAIIIILMITFVIKSLIQANNNESFFSSQHISYIASNTLKKAPWKTFTVKQHDNLQLIFKRAHLQSKDYGEIILLKSASASLKKLQPNHNLYILTNKKNELQKLVYNINNLQYLEILRINGKFQAKTIQQTLEERIEGAEITIKHSLSNAVIENGFSGKIIAQLVNIFNSKIDFARQIRPHDKFKILFTQYYVNGKKIKTGKILAAEFINHQKTYTAIYFKKPHGKSDYYTLRGQSLRRAFLRAPLKYTRVSSPFNEKRMHPILHIIRPHEGVDLAAPMGTPIHASGDGKIIFRSRKGGYGKVIIIQNGPKYSTLFAHMSRFSNHFHLGSHVKKGQIIGYVGQTGMATGPHLHYEFRIYGVHYDPMKVKLPHASPIPRKDKKTFLAEAHKMEAELAQIKS